MEKIPITDQWKLDGNCIQCRRSSYCRKNCSALTKRKNKIIEDAYWKVMKEKYPELNEVLSKTINDGKD